MQAVVCFADGEKNREVAAALRVSERSVERWRRPGTSTARPGSCRRALRAGPGSAKRRSPGRSESWSVARWSVAGRTSGGRWRGSRGPSPDGSTSPTPSKARGGC
ncbi:helix-turn-helix domain-containing protein [Streptomyces sp. NPDC093516]|uniref:helix-turn-helix domain-containing protein n=1 Tax=Streptomyces sp. NPDC093516 TaxID=3155304 RepID=UPI003415053E